MDSFNPFTPEGLADPYAQYRRYREQDPIHYSEKLRTWVTFRYDDTYTFFKDDTRLSIDRTAARKFNGPRASSQPGRSRSIQIDPPEHTSFRRLVMSQVTPRVRAFGPAIDAIVERYLDQAQAEVARQAAVVQASEGAVDLLEEFAYPLPVTVIAELMGVPQEERHFFQEHAREQARAQDHTYSRGGTANDAGARLAHYLEGLVERRRRAPGDDLLSGLLGAEHDGDRMTDREVVSMAAGLLFAGHETTVNLIANGMLALLRNPEELERLQGEPGLAETAVEEFLRYEPPVRFVSRTAREDFEWRGRRIEQGDSVIGLIASANRDPEIFQDPDRLDVGRDPNPHLSFGWATHFCVGANLARREAVAAIPALLERFPRMRLVEEGVAWRGSAMFRGLERLPVVVTG